MSVSPPHRAGKGCKSVSILGATGSIGQNTVDLIARAPDRFDVHAVTARRNVRKLADIALKVKARFAVIADPTHYSELKRLLAGSGIDVGAGDHAVVEAAGRPADWVMGAIVGAAGLKPSLAVIRRGACLALANKETLVCAGDLVMAEVARHHAVLLPVDSEHSAIFQVFDFNHPERVSRILLTASGGPFRRFKRDEMAHVTPQQAVAHPNWSMGAKISVDSATMMNKGLELIEAAHLFPVPEELIDILVHPQSVVHGMVEYKDGSVLAQMGSPDMRTPISYSLAWPERMACPAPKPDFATIGALTFEAPDPERFPSLRLARDALKAGGSAPAVLNAANEQAVAAFLKGALRFLDIADCVAHCLNAIAVQPLQDVDAVTHIDQRARSEARAFIESKQ